MDMQDYQIDLDVKYGLELIDVDAIERAAPAGWVEGATVSPAGDA